MKRILLSLLLFILIGSNKSLYAQCTVSNATISNLVLNPLTCKVTFDLSFTATLNNGSKFSVLHLYQSTNYPATITYPASAAATAGAIGTLVIKDPKTNPIVEPNYAKAVTDGLSGGLSSPYLVPTSATITNVGNVTRFDFIGLSVSTTNCSSGVTINGDIYSTNNGNNTSGGCVNRGGLTITNNDPGLQGLLICSSPRRFTLSIKTSTTTNVTFSAYRDVAPLGVFDAADQQPANLLTISNGVTTGTSITVNNAGSSTIYNTYGPFSYSQQSPGSQFPLYIVATAGANNFSNVLHIENSCGLLPVHFKSFTASRKEDKVLLKWETASEQNNKGFYVQRNTGDEWKDVAFVFAQSQNGNSTSDLSYSYTDLNPAKGVTHYRILQVDLDGSGHYSELRSVHGKGSTTRLMLFPNPSTTGAVTLVFDSESARTIVVSDLSGRTVQQVKTVAAGSYVVKNLGAGFYTVQVTEAATGTTSTEKFMITKR